MQWSHHITNTSNKACKVLNFLRRDVRSMLKQQLFLLLYGPLWSMTLSVVWDPHLNAYINMPEKKQRRAAARLIAR